MVLTSLGEILIDPESMPLTHYYSHQNCELGYFGCD